MSIQNLKTKVAAATAAMVASGSALADNNAAITEAITSGKGLVELTTGGVISIAAVCFGVGLVASMLIKR